MNALRISLFIYFLITTSFSCKEDNNEAHSRNRYLKQTVQYKSLKDISKNLLSLDIYYFQNTSALKPVVIYVHGGGWCLGDKANQITNKTGLFEKQGYIFVSVNYRLSPYPYQTGTQDRIKYPDHNNDIADAVKWVFDNISEYGGDKNKIALLGHSAGAHLVSLTGTNEKFLKSRGLSPAVIKGVASIDTKAYDVYEQIHFSPVLKMMYINAFGTDSVKNIEASPVYNVHEGTQYPCFFIALRGSKERKAPSIKFIKKLEQCGVRVSWVDGSMYDHKGINNAIGDENDNVITPPLINFFENCFR